jgi:hypothetical protein
VSANRGLSPDPRRIRTDYVNQRDTCQVAETSPRGYPPRQRNWQFRQFVLRARISELPEELFLARV